VDADQALIARVKAEAPFRTAKARNGLAADLWLSGWVRPARAGERVVLTVNLDNSDGILGLDLKLDYDPTRVAIVDVQSTGIGSRLMLAKADRQGTYRIAAFDALPLAGSGSILTITVEALKNTSPQDLPTASAVANEGQIPIRIGGGARKNPPRGNSR
jgi:hypothetical protein